MDARYLSVCRCALTAAVILTCTATTSVGQVRMYATSGPNVRGMAAPKYAKGTRNFIVFASSPEEAETMAAEAERLRKELAIYWLGAELPAWSGRCPLHIHAAPNLPASGETNYQLVGNTVGGWRMSVSGTRERVLDSVLPHEISHTIFASHFCRHGNYMPRWADEGACTTVEHESEKRKHRGHLKNFLKTGRGLPFNYMFRLEDYPDDIMPLYAQGHSVVQFLIDQAGPRKFVEFIDRGMASNNWPAALKKVYLYDSIGNLQVSWNKWLANGAPKNLSAYSPLVASQVRLASAEGTAFSPAAIQPAVAADTIKAGPVAATSVSWYQRRLTEVTGEAPPKYDGGPRTSTGVGTAGTATPPRQISAARQSPTQSLGIQVHNWGQHAPVPGMVPIRR